MSLLDMLDKYGLAFYKLGELLQAFNVTALLIPSHGMDSPDPEQRASILARLADMRFNCHNVGLALSVVAIDRIVAWPEEVFTYEYLRRAWPELQTRIMDELAAVRFMYVPSDKAGYYEETNLFGQAVTDQFPAAILDLEEAGKCFALSRHTACVMHLMRAIEVGLRAFGTSLGVLAAIRAAQPDWGGVLRVVNTEIQRLNGSGDPTWTREKRTFFENAYAYFHAIRVAWRNPSMHVGQAYDEERAQDIYNAVKSWMRQMAKHLDELGQFTP